MSDDLSIQGTLAETTVPDLFRSIIRSSETGIVSLEAIGRNDTIYFVDGRVVFASSSDPDTGLGEVLLRSGEINLQQYTHALEQLVASRRIGALLCELGYLQMDELTRAVERQARAIIVNAIRYRAGSYTVTFTSDFPQEILTLHLPTERLILDGIASIEFWSLISRGLGRLTRLLEQAPGADARSFHLELNDDEAYVLSLFDEPRTIEAICAQSYLSNFVTCRTLWGLLCVNLVHDAEAVDVDGKRAAQESEYELEEIVENYNSAFQKIFNMVFQRIGDHTYDFMDRVVLHVSPETMPYLSGMNLVNEARIDFDQLLTNLIASGSQDHAPIVHNVLNELLYGWIIEIKSEFGASAEKDVVRMVEALRR